MRNHNRPIPALMTVKDLALYLNVHQSTIYRLLRANQLPCMKIGSDWRFHREAIDQWIRDRTKR